MLQSGSTLLLGLVARLITGGGTSHPATFRADILNESPPPRLIDTTDPLRRRLLSIPANVVSTPSTVATLTIT
jgi:hypothetical protein